MLLLLSLVLVPFLVNSTDDIMILNVYVDNDNNALNSVLNTDAIDIIGIQMTLLSSESTS